jgi:hypothetical protein
MTEGLSAPLRPEEFTSLEEVGRGMDHRPIPSAHKDKLMKLGLIRENFEGLCITDVGTVRIPLSLTSRLVFRTDAISSMSRPMSAPH